MTILNNSIRIDATPEQVWSSLATLDALDQYDPGISRSELISAQLDGIGAERKCDMAAGGWFKERVTEWKPGSGLAFELFDCTLPLRDLKHSYVLRPDGAGTVISQRMEYRLKFGAVGTVIDTLMVRRKWDAGIKGFFLGLKRRVEAETTAAKTK